MITDADLMFWVPFELLLFAGARLFVRWLAAPEDRYPGLLTLLTAQHEHRRRRMYRAAGVWATPEDAFGALALSVLAALLVLFVVLT